MRNAAVALAASATLRRPAALSSAQMIWSSGRFLYPANQDKVMASLGIPRRSSGTYGETVRNRREKKPTFGEAIASAEFMLVQKSRLHIVRRELFE